MDAISHIACARRRRHARLLLPLLLLAAALAGPAACVTTEPEAGYGAQPRLLGFVPAATAILPCQVWPAGARYVDLPLSTAKDDELRALCASLDAVVLKAYDGQPFMRAFSPRFVTRALGEAGKAELPAALPRIWGATADACRDCGSPPAFYASSIESRTAWLQWLADLSAGVRNADAVLLPFVTHAYEKRYDDRGLAVAERGAGVALLLVDTARGELIWAGGREAVAPAKRLATAPDARELAPPPWADVESRLYTEDLWRDFPGRQVH